MKRLHSTNNWLPSLLDEVFNNQIETKSFRTTAFKPAVNIAETDDAFTLSMQVPGFEKEEITIDLDHDVLTISSEVDTAEATDGFTRKEFTKQSFSRKFNLPESVDQEKIEADYKNGILNVLMPVKEEAKPQPKRHIALK